MELLEVHFPFSSCTYRLLEVPRHFHPPTPRDWIHVAPLTHAEPGRRTTI
jgi:hypothetical protein